MVMDKSNLVNRVNLVYYYTKSNMIRSYEQTRLNDFFDTGVENEM